MIAAAALAAALAATGGGPDPVRAALDLVYDGQTDTALVRLSALAAAAPDDPRPAYAHALALAWKAEQYAEPGPADRELLARAQRVIALSDARLRARPGDAQAFLFRGAGHGLVARHHLFRLHRGDAARASVRMRADLLRAQALDPADPETAFGLGLYDYYADVLPRAARLLRFLAGLPGGDRARGLRAVEAARASAPLHGVEAQAQLYEIYAFHEERPDRALAEVAALRARYPRSALWPLKMAEHLRVRLGAFDESAAVARALLAGPHETFRNPAVVALARLALGEALLLDLRPAEARRALLPAADGVPGAPALRAQARFLLGRSLEMEGDAVGAAAHYRLAAQGGGGPFAERARAALRSPLPAARVRARQHLGEARRHAEAGRSAAALAAYREAREEWPQSAEAALALADDALRQGDRAAARRALPRLDDEDQEETPWLRTWRWLLEAQLAEAEGEREDAVALYTRALRHADGHPLLKSRAEEGLKGPARPSPPAAAERRRPAPPVHDLP